MPEKRRVLDIGIGKGGDYISKDTPNTLRIGLDINPYIDPYIDPDNYTLKSLKATYNIPLICADGSGDVPLPFTSGSFDHIDVIFPLDDLLYGLCNSTLLWTEFYRVLKTNGDITIIIDVPWEGIQGIKRKGNDEHISDPKTKILDMGENHKFEIDIDTLDPEETEQIGTELARSASSWQKELHPTKVYAINARKITSPTPAGDSDTI